MWGLSSSSALQAGRDVAQSKLSFLATLHAIEPVVGGREKLLNGHAVGGIQRDTDAYGHWRRLAIVGKALADPGCHAVGFLLADFGKDHGKLIPSVASGSVDGAAVTAQSVSEALDGAASRQVPV